MPNRNSVTALEMRVRTAKSNLEWYSTEAAASFIMEEHVSTAMQIKSVILELINENNQQELNNIQKIIQSLKIKPQDKAYFTQLSSEILSYLASCISLTPIMVTY